MQGVNGSFYVEKTNTLKKVKLYEAWWEHSVWFVAKVLFVLSMTLDFIGLETSERNFR